MSMGPKGEGWHDESVQPEQMHAAGSLNEGNSDVIPTSPESEEIKAEKAAASAERNAENAETLAAAQTEAKEAAGM